MSVPRLVLSLLLTGLVTEAHAAPSYSNCTNAELPGSLGTPGLGFDTTPAPAFTAGGSPPTVPYNVEVDFGLTGSTFVIDGNSVGTILVLSCSTGFTCAPDQCLQIDNADASLDFLYVFTDSTITNRDVYVGWGYGPGISYPFTASTTVGEDPYLLVAMEAGDGDDELGPGFPVGGGATLAATTDVRYAWAGGGGNDVVSGTQSPGGDCLIGGSMFSHTEVAFGTACGGACDPTTWLTGTDIAADAPTFCWPEANAADVRDTIYGDHTLFTAADMGADLIIGSEGDDVIWASGQYVDAAGPDLVFGDFGLAGGSGGDWLAWGLPVGTGAGDIISSGLTGTFDLSTGITVSGGPGDDDIFLDGQYDVANGEYGAVKNAVFDAAGITGVTTNTADFIRGGAGKDTLYGGFDEDTLLGDEDPDQIAGGPGDDRLVDLDGSGNVLKGNGGDDILCAVDPADTLEGGVDDDILWTNFVQTALIDGGGGSNDACDLGLTTTNCNVAATPPTPPAICP